MSEEIGSAPRVMAEIAQGYEGRPDYAHFYVDAAARARADAVKFQIVFADDVLLPDHEHYALFTQLQMGVEVWRALREQARDLGMRFHTNVSGDAALEIAESIEPDAIQIATTNFFNRPLIRRAFDAAASVHVCLGGIERHEVQAFVDEADSWGCRARLVLNYGFQSEPTPPEHSALCRISALRKLFPDVPLCYMDHAAGGGEDAFHISIMAMTLGVQWIEKHLTLNRYMEVEDFVSGLEPAEFSRFVATLRRLHPALGSSEMALTDGEQQYRDKAIKKLVTTRDLQAGHELKVGDIGYKRVTGIPRGEAVYDERLVIGRILQTDLLANVPLTEDVLT